MDIKRITETDFSEADVNHLLAQQSPGVRHIDAKDLQEALSNPHFYFLAALNDNCDYMGMATIFFQRNLARWIAEVHDVVVDEQYRGMGIGKDLTIATMNTALLFAIERNVSLKLFLTSRPSRVVANNLYRKLGFVLVAEATGQWGTNLYKIIVEPSGFRGLP